MFSITHAVLWSLRKPLRWVCHGLRASSGTPDWSARWLGWLVLLLMTAAATAAEDWTQLKFDSRHSGNAPDRHVKTPMELLAAAPLTDAILTAPVVAGGRVYAIDASGVAFCLDAQTLRVVWKTSTGNIGNCNNVSSPVLVGRYLHFGTAAGTYYILDVTDGKPVRKIECGEPIFSAPVAGKDRVYFATLGSVVHAIAPDGTPCWTWDFVKEVLDFSGDRWNGVAWRDHLQAVDARHSNASGSGKAATLHGALVGRVTNTEQFLCSRDIALDGSTVVLPAGGSLVWLEDTGEKAEVRRMVRQHTPTLALSIGEDGTVYRQWHWLDNLGQVNVFRRNQARARDVLPRPKGFRRDIDTEMETAAFGAKEGVDYVAGTRTSTAGGLLSFSSVSVRGGDIYRCRPEEGFGLCRHTLAGKPQRYEGCSPSIASPVLAGDRAVYGGLDGRLYVVPLAGSRAWSFPTAFGKPISAPAAVVDGRVYFGCEDGYLYALAPGADAPRPTKDLKISKIRSPLQSPLAGPKYDRFTAFGDWGNSNFSEQGLKPPMRLHWIRRYEGTTKHFSTFGEGRMYTNTAEGQVFAVEQETGRLLWRRYFPGVHICYTAALYYQGKLLVPHAGLDAGRLRCLDAATGDLLWEAPFSGSPSWNRQLPPVVHKNLVFYMFGTGRYGPEVPESERMAWFFGHQHEAGFPPSHRPLVRAYDLRTGREVWTKDFSEYGSGGDDAGLCLMDGRLYYSCFFGYAAKSRDGGPGPHGVTAALEPESGKIHWLTSKYSIHSGCTISAKDGRLYLGGYDPPLGDKDCHVWCLDAKNGSLVWQSEPLLLAIHVATITPQFIFIHAQYKESYLLDKNTGHLLATLQDGYKCSRLSLCDGCLLGPSLDVSELTAAGTNRLFSTGPRLDPSECIGGCVSNGRIFYTGHGGGLQASLLYGEEAKTSGEKGD
jgi:outer membrane protein assembly factor BamB